MPKKVNEAEEDDVIRDIHWAQVKAYHKGDRRDKDSILRDLGYDKEDRERLKKS